MNEITLKSPQKIEIMAEGGRIAAEIREELVRAAQPGVMTLELDQLAAKLMAERGVTASFKDFQGYQHSIVTCLNEEVVHGIPSGRKLEEGDLLTIDLGVKHRGFHTDTAATVEVSEPTSAPNVSRITDNDFLNIGKSALKGAIQQCVPGNRIGDISSIIQETIEAAGFSPIRAFVGHGIGQQMHEPPQIPCVGVVDTGALLKAGMTLAVEVMYAQGSYEVDVLEDGWTTVTRNGGLAAMFEHTVAITTGGPRVLTA